VRGSLLMAISNKFGAMVLTTGNKSEMSVGYATLYGDMNGGFNPIKDLYKMEVYALCHWRNRHVPKGAKGPPGIVIPENILTKAPTAELRAEPWGTKARDVGGPARATATLQLPPGSIPLKIRRWRRLDTSVCRPRRMLSVGSLTHEVSRLEVESPLKLQR